MSQTSIKVILFDVNETLLDLSALRPHFETALGDANLMQAWFAQLLHSSLTVTLAGDYHDFGALAGAALDLVVQRHELSLSTADRDRILGTMRQLPPHPEVPASLERLQASGLRLAALTNSSRSMLDSQMANAGLAGYFEKLLSVDGVRRFKPAPQTYQMAAKTMGVAIEQMRMVAAHDWDVFGALRAGATGAFIARGDRPFHPLYGRPDIVGKDLAEVAELIIRASRA